MKFEEIEENLFKKAQTLVKIYKNNSFLIIENINPSKFVFINKTQLESFDGERYMIKEIGKIKEFSELKDFMLEINEKSQLRFSHNVPKQIDGWVLLFWSLNPSTLDKGLSLINQTI